MPFPSPHHDHASDGGRFTKREWELVTCPMSTQIGDNFRFSSPPPRRRLTSTGKQLTMDESTFLFTSESVSEGHPGIAYND